MIQTIFKYIGILTLVLSYLFLVWNYTKNGFNSHFTLLFNTAWILGIASVITNAVYVILADLPDDYLWWIGFVGLIWFVPFFVDWNTTYGVPSLIIYFMVIAFVHRDLFTRQRVE